MAASGIFVAGVEAVFLALVPLKFLPGHDLYHWKRGVWAATWGLGLFLFVLGIIAPGVEGPEAIAPLGAGALILGFNAVAIAVWLYFRKSGQRVADESPARQT